MNCLRCNEAVLKIDGRWFHESNYYLEHMAAHHPIVVEEGENVEHAYVWSEVEEYLRGAAKGSEEEQCGFIAHDPNPSGQIAPALGLFFIFPIRNEHDLPKHNYLMSRLDQVKAFDYISDNKLKLWGAYHTHAGKGASAEPSKRDKEYWKYAPEFRMIIATRDEVTVWEDSPLRKSTATLPTSKKDQTA